MIFVMLFMSWTERVAKWFETDGEIMRGFRNVFHFVVICRGQCKDKADQPNDTNGQVGLGMWQLTAHGIHDHSVFFKTDDHQSINGSRKGQDLGKWTYFTHDDRHVPSLRDAGVELKGGENQGQNDVTDGQVDDEFIDDSFHGSGGFPDPDDQGITDDG